jgi:NAD(P)-dependent dehydrogenase (short-subunit alcohol dehydrogenase family)
VGGRTDYYTLAGASAIALSSRTLADLKGVEAEISQISPRTTVFCQEADIAIEEGTIGLSAKVKAVFSQLDIAVVNAGTSPKLLVNTTARKDSQLELSRI